MNDFQHTKVQSAPTMTQSGVERVQPERVPMRPDGGGAPVGGGVVYPVNFEEKVGFDQVRAMLRERCLCGLGSDRVEAMCFSPWYAEVLAGLEQTSEMVDVLGGDSGLPSSHYYDMREALHRVRLEGMWLDERELFDLRRSLEAIRDVVGVLLGHGDGEEVVRWPRLRVLACDVELFPGVLKAIGGVLSAYGEVRDDASEALGAIRRQLAGARGGISRMLMGILRAAQAEGLVDRDVSPTLRDGRLVIPVAPGLKRRIGGIVHDESASGKTVYIEPAEVVEANNRVRELESEERREVVRILTELTAQIRPLIPGMLVSYEFLGEVDFIRAKALLAREMEATLPVVSDGCAIGWRRAVHPLLRASLARHGREAVPLDLEMWASDGVDVGCGVQSSVGEGALGVGGRGSGRRILIISGPNAGGKSVCLKTVGLLQYMLQCGLLIPVAEGSKAGIFRRLFIDIGDEQSIEDELSTYSSHLRNLKEMLRSADERSLVLIDEFGGGTEPRIGGAIAEAVLKRLHVRGVWGVITTHYHNLKQWADAHEGVVNGAMLYDRQRMQPLFQLEVGRAGSSFAVEIARKIGLPEEVIRDASDTVGSDYINSDKYLLDIVRDKRYWKQKRREIRQREKQLEETLARSQAEAEELHSRRSELLRQAREEAERLLDESRAKIERTIQEIKEGQAERERTRRARAELDAWRERLSSLGGVGADGSAGADVVAVGGSVAEVGGAGAADEVLRQMERIRARQCRQKERRERAREGGQGVAGRSGQQGGQGGQPVHQGGRDVVPMWQVGDAVRLRGQSAVGRVLALKQGGREVVVAFGGVKSTLSAGRLEGVSDGGSVRGQSGGSAGVSGKGSSVGSVGGLSGGLEGEKHSGLGGRSTFVSAQTGESMRRKQLDFRQELDVRGMRGEEAVRAVMYYLDDALMIGVDRVRILHGTGTGALRTMIRQYLGTVGGVRGYHDEHPRLGGAGVTVVEF